MAETIYPSGASWKGIVSECLILALRNRVALRWFSIFGDLFIIPVMLFPVLNGIVLSEGLQAV